MRRIKNDFYVPDSTKYKIKTSLYDCPLCDQNIGWFKMPRGTKDAKAPCPKCKKQLHLMDYSQAVQLALRGEV